MTQTSKTPVHKKNNMPDPLPVMTVAAMRTLPHNTCELARQAHDFCRGLDRREWDQCPRLRVQQHPVQMRAEQCGGHGGCPFWKGGRSHLLRVVYNVRHLIRGRPRHMKMVCPCGPLGGRAFNFGGGGGRYSPLAANPPPPPERLNCRGLQNPTETDPWAPGGHSDPKVSKRMKMGFLESARQGGSEKASFAMCLVGVKVTIFNAQNKSRRLRHQSSYYRINGPVS